MNFRLLGTAVISVVALGGCSGDKEADAAPSRVRREGSVAPRPSVVETPKQPYRAVTVTSGSKLTGTVDFDGPMPTDSVIHIPADVQGCGHTISPQTVQRTGTKIGGVIVWISDIRTGKPLPVERRFELANEGCLFNPRVQAVISPGTLNVASEDVAMHRNRIINVETGELEGIAPFNDNGEVVPFDRLLLKPAQLEITCELHPWSKAWILAFDHPYFSVSERSGTFAIENVPAGTYRVRAWHPVLGLAEQSVTIAAGQPAALALRLSHAPQQPAAQPESAASAPQPR
jgi:hypothetical protein